MNPGNKFRKFIAQGTVGMLAIIFFLHFPLLKLKAEDEKTATIQLSFDQSDSTRSCKAVVVSSGAPVKEIEVHFYVKRMYNPLPIGKAIETDENGEAVASFPLDLPGDKNGNLIVIAKIEDDDTFGNVETMAEIKWGVLQHSKSDEWSNRSLSASREKAPMYLILASNLIIAVIWGTIFYVIVQVFRIKKESRISKNK